MSKRINKFSIVICLTILLATLTGTGAYAACTHAPEISVSRANERSSYLVVTSTCADDTYYDVQYKFDTKANGSFSGLGYTVSNANESSIVLPSDFGDYYLYAKSVNGNEETTKVFGPYNVGNNGFIDITSADPDPDESYDSFTVNYRLSSPYIGNTIDLNNSNYIWTTSPTNNAGTPSKFSSAVGSISTPVGVKGTYYLHMSVVDSGGYQAYQVVGPVKLSGSGQTVYFSGIQQNVNKQTVTINVGLPSSQVNFGSSKYQVIPAGGSTSGTWNSLTGSATQVTITNKGSYQIVVDLVTSDGVTTRFTSDIFSVGTTSGDSTISVTYSPKTWTNSKVLASIVATDSYGNKCEPITSGIVRKSDTNYEYTVEENGSYVLQWTTPSGQVISTTLQVNWIDTEGPTIKFTEDYEEMKIVLSDAASGISSDSYVMIGDEEEALKKASNLVYLDKYYVGCVKVVAIDLAGNETHKLYEVENLPSGWDVDIEYDKLSSTRYEALISIDDNKNIGYEITTKSGWVKNPDNTYSVYFATNGSKELVVKTKDNKTFTILLAMDRLSNTGITVDFDYSKNGRVNFELEYDEDVIDIDWENSYYHFIGEKKSQMDADENSYSLRIREDGEYQPEIVIYTKNGDRTKITGDVIVAEGDSYKVYEQYAWEDGKYTEINSGNSNSNSSFNSNSNTMTGNISFNKNHTAYLGGYPDGTYGLRKQVTRAEFLAMLDKITTGGNGTGNVSLSDVRSGDWFYSPVMRFVNMGVVYYNGNSYNPNGPISRAEVAYILHRLGTNSEKYSAANFSDISGHWAYSDIISANKKGLIAGYTDGTFKPDAYITRVEAVAMLNRAAGRTCSYNNGNVGTKTPPAYEIATSHWAYPDVLEAINSH